MNYVFVHDDCETCQYVHHAFTLLKMSLDKQSIDSLTNNSEAIAKSISVIACKNIENQHSKKLSEIINAHNICLISFNDPYKSNHTGTPVYYLTKSFSKYELKSVLSHCMNHKNGSPDFVDLKYPIFEKLIGESEQIRKIKSMIKQVAYSDSTVLILGQSGTGKDVIATCIHYLSERRDHPLVPINCGAIPSELMESELFGHEKGAFTGALNRRSGRFEIANSGTLFLDEIGDMPLPMQVKLLRVIQDRKIERVGGNASVDVNVRLIAATNKNLSELIQQSRFREDLFYRLNVFPIQVPSLSERHEDIPLLIDHHLDKIYDRLKHRVVFTERAKEILCGYAWPGNIRELQNFLERMVILFPDGSVDEKNIDAMYKQKKPTAVEITPELPSNAPFNIKEHLSKIEQQLIAFALERSNGMVHAAAEYLSLGKNTLMEKMKKYNLSSES